MVKETTWQGHPAHEARLTTASAMSQHHKMMGIKICDSKIFLIASIIKSINGNPRRLSFARGWPVSMPGYAIGTGAHPHGSANRIVDNED
jgi:hypothetical protein